VLRRNPCTNFSIEGFEGLIVELPTHLVFCEWRPVPRRQDGAS
jgi:hypothetical protein